MPKKFYQIDPWQKYFRHRQYKNNLYYLYIGIGVVLRKIREFLARKKLEIYKTFTNSNGDVSRR
jgi:hypothetical protein